MYAVVCNGIHLPSCFAVYLKNTVSTSHDRLYNFENEFCVQLETRRSRQRLVSAASLAVSPDTDDWSAECEIPEDALLYFERNGHICVRSLLEREYVHEYVPDLLQQVGLTAFNTLIAPAL